MSSSISQRNSESAWRGVEGVIVALVAVVSLAFARGEISEAGLGGGVDPLLVTFDGSQISFVGQSLGAIVGIPFLALEPTVNVSLLSVPGGGIARMLDGSQTFGPRIRAGLQAAGVVAGTPDYDRFMGAAQQVIDSVDPINYGFASLTDAMLLHEVIGDTVIPNAVAGAPLSGTEPLIRVLGLETIVETTVDPSGIRGAVRFIEGTHGSLLDPGPSPAATAEMHRQMASMLVSGGTTVVVTDTSVIRTQ